MTTIDNIQNTILPRPFWGVDKGGNFIGFLSFIAINCLIFIVIGDKLKYDKYETYNFEQSLRLGLHLLNYIVYSKTFIN